MERAIGEKFAFGRTILKVSESRFGTCYKCYFYVHRIPCDFIISGECCDHRRSDNKSVEFIEVKE